MSEIAKQLYAATETTISADSYPGYPTSRLVVVDAHERTDLTLPDGPWTTRVMPFPNLDEQQKLVDQGYELDAFGRPLHPWLRDMLSNPEVGVVTGTGEYWHWGPNRTTDSIVLSNEPVPKVLLIQRSDTGKWALAGGFLEDGENPVEAALRELHEETGILLSPNGDSTTIYDGVVADLRTTAHAWAETTAMLWYVDHTPQARGGDDAINAQWFDSTNLPDELHGSHAVLIKKALEAQRPLKTAHIISFPAESYRHASGGHMAYRRIIATHSDGSETFIKSHDKHAFTDPVREGHSRLYLHKEKHLYDHLRQAGFAHIPSFVNLLDTNTLAIQSLSDKDSWQWRAPADQLEQYVTGVFAAIDALSVITPPFDFKDNEVPVYQTLTQEGWDMLTPDSYAAIAHKLYAWRSKLRPDFQNVSESFYKRLPTIEQEFRKVTAPAHLYLCHHDMRQANIAWHPNDGVRLVDWSWAGLGSKDSDTTMLLIDLHKAGHDVERFMDRFDDQHARTLMGFWLSHCLMPTQGDDSVRFHQLVSAISAYDLLAKYRER